jgi:SPOR domain
VQFVTDWPQKVEMGYMKVTCPKCQFENQADSSRVVCARCATIIEVRMDQGFDSNGKRQTARLPFTSGGLSGAPSLGSQRFNQNNDVYATRIGDDFDDVLDVPIQSQSGYQPVDDTPPAPIFEDVFTTGQNQDQPSPYDYSSYDKPSAPLDAFAPPVARQRDPQDYLEPVEQDFVGWPVMTEGQEEEEEETRSGRGGFFLRLSLIVGLLGVLGFWAYYFIPDFIAKRKGSRSTPQNTELAGNPGGSETGTIPKPEPTIVTDPPEQPSPDTKIPPDDRVVFPKPVSKKDEGDGKPSVITNTLKTPAPLQTRGGLTVQVDSFKDQGEADARASNLNAATNGEFHVVQATIPGKGVWFRVQHAKGFASREAALRYGNGLRAKNLISDFIVTAR